MRYLVGLYFHESFAKILFYKYFLTNKSHYFFFLQKFPIFYRIWTGEIDMETNVSSGFADYNLM